MQIRDIKIRNFRGIASLDWRPEAAYSCLIGSGDSGKSTILDAIEAALSPRWLWFSESDFFNCDTASPIVIEISVGELSRALKSDDRFGLFVRGWTTEGNVRDEPEDGDEPILTVRLTVDATMEPVWQLVCDRADEPRTLSNRDRSFFCLVRLAGDDSRHLAWGQGSVLARLTDETDEASARLAAAYKAARANANLHDIRELTDAAGRAESLAKTLGAYVEQSYAPGLELGRSGLSTSSIALHDNGVPLRLAGLGTKRLATLAIQKSAVSEGAIVLVDEIELGLEPHRIAGAIAQLQADQARAVVDGHPLGHVLVTTHSDIAVAEAGAASVRVVQVTRPGRAVDVRRPSSPATLLPVMRFAPRALFARRILVTEGNTEVGLLSGVQQYWPPRHESKPIAHVGAAIVDGHGSQAVALALTLRSLGYVTAVFRDSDLALPAATRTTLNEVGIEVVEYGANLNTEQAIFLASSDDLIDELLTSARSEFGAAAIDTWLREALPAIDISTLRGPFAHWPKSDSAQLRATLADTALRRKWLKDERRARGVASIVWKAVTEEPSSPLASALQRVEAWLYA